MERSRRFDMLKLPRSILSKLSCVLCGGHLSCAPVMVAQSGRQICGECFKVLPNDKKAEYTRQIGFEAVAEVLIFPCRYSLQGCSHTFPWNGAKEHEPYCRHNDSTLPLDTVNRTSENSMQADLLNLFGNSDEHTFESDDLKMTVKVQNVQGLDFDGNKLKMQWEIEGSGGSILALAPISSHIPTRLKIDTLVSLSDNPYLNYSFVEATPQENIYSSITSFSGRCNHCNSVMLDEVYHCLFGHPTCVLCKGNPCKVCSRTIIGDASSPCKNFARGCSVLIPTRQIRGHEFDCEYNDYRCPVNDCPFSDALQNLIVHCKLDHSEKMILSKTTTAKFKGFDKDLYFCCIGKMFVLKYFVFDDTVEFVLKYMGSNDGASLYKYETTVNTELFRGPKTRRCKCLGWNESALSTAIRYQTKPENYALRIDFEATITILQ